MPTYASYCYLKCKDNVAGRVDKKWRFQFFAEYHYRFLLDVIFAIITTVFASVPDWEYGYQNADAGVKFLDDDAQLWNLYVFYGVNRFSRWDGACGRPDEPHLPLHGAQVPAPLSVPRGENRQVWL